MRAGGFRGMLAALALALPAAALAAEDAAPATVEAPPGVTPIRRFALIAGANDGGEGRVKLRFAVSDAEAMAHVLEELGGLDDADRLLLAEPDRATFLGGFAQLRERMGSLAKGAARVELLVYYSGHSDEEGLLLQGERLGYKELRAAIQEMPADVRIAVVDSCASGALTRAKGGKWRPPFVVDASAEVSGHAYLTSSSADEVAQESDRVGGSFFTHYLISGMRGAADVTRDGRVTLNEAYQFAFNETLARTEKTRSGPQHPGFDIQLVGTGDLVMTDLRGTSAGLRLSEELAGRFYVRGPGGQLAAELAKPRGQAVELGLPPGAYTLLLDEGDGRREASIALASGEKLVITDAMLATVARLEVTTARGGAGTTAAETPVEVALLPGLGVFGAMDHHLALGLVGVRSERVEGTQLAFGGVFATELEGLQLALAETEVSGKAQGVQLVLGAASAGSGSELVQLSLGLNTVHGELVGSQITAGLNRASSLRGVQGSAGVNWVEGRLDGVQLTSGVNRAGELHGVQVGLVNLGGDTEGLQIGLVNVGGDVHGLQVGLVNVSRDMHGVPLGLVNYVEEGRFELVGWGSEVGLAGLALEMGGHSNYGIFSYGVEVRPLQRPGHQEEAWSWTAVGFGHSVQAAERLTVDFELLAGTVDQGFETRGTTGSVLASFRTVLAWESPMGFGLFAGPSLNGMLSWAGEEPRFAGRPQLHVVEAGRPESARFWPGLVAGLRL